MTIREEYIRILQSQCETSNHNEPTKMNIHIPLRGSAFDYCFQLNAKILQVASSTINFGPSSFHIPHITINMGYLNNSADFIVALDSLYALAKEQNIFKIQLSKIYLKEPSKNYVFIDIDQIDRVFELKHIVSHRLGGLIMPLDWDVVNERPHVTVAYIEDNFNAVEDLLLNYPLGPECTADALEISFAGPKGSCLGSLRSFYFT